ncbi:MAG: ATP-binding cassette domain-containing protein [Cytophagales bacterium]|nr:MAG: ATP-binding cassette domain-containing protein [Cytophagales bacterium]
MSEEILKALAQLYAIVSKQDGGATSIERTYVINSFKKKLNIDTVKEYVALFDDFVGYEEQKNDVESTSKPEKLTSVKDSVKTLVICKKINKTLTQKQKVVVIIELLEMVKSNRKLTPQRMQIIHTVADAFNLEKEEYTLLEQFVLENNISNFSNDHIIIINNKFPFEKHIYQTKYLFSEYIEGTVLFYRISSTEMIFFRYIGESDMSMNGITVASDDVILFSPGSIARSSKGSSFYYSDIVNNFISNQRQIQLVFNVKNLEFKFPNQAIGLRNINISEDAGNLIGIMGASGAGKTTLLNVMAGIEKPSKGEVLLNGINIHTEREKIQGAFGYVAQDDLLIEELSVFDNLYFNAKFCFNDLSNEEITEKVNKVLSNLGLEHIKHLEVGNPMNKKISGGQRKRLNIALELIREPSVLFVDEPTSGLSSRDSENVIDLLKELSLKGRLIFVVIHQPSSDIYKIFDKMYILDTGGYFIFNGHPIDAITYFKRISNQVDSDHGQCNSCGNINVEQLFNIIEEKVVDEYGNYTNNRKITPNHWNEFFLQNFQVKFLSNLTESAPKILKIPSKIQQLLIYINRDLKTKWSNQQYMIINLLEAGILSLILSVIIRYTDNPEGIYKYRNNDNIPAYILMSIVVALFIGLSISAEEIIKDRKILKRESLLHLSRFSYLSSKLIILFSFSAFQAFTFVLVGNSILAIKSMTLEYWLILWSIGCMANVLGLLISSGFNTAVTVYIIIPLLLIPQMILSGAMFNFDKINSLIGNKKNTPVIADFMASRWAFEALAVEQFKSNQFERNFFDVEQIINISDFHLVYTLPEIEERLDNIAQNLGSKEVEQVNTNKSNLEIIRNELNKQVFLLKNIDKEYFNQLNINTISTDKIEQLKSILITLEDTYKNIFNQANKKKDFISQSLLQQLKINNVTQLKDEYHNESLADLVVNTENKNKFIIFNQEIYPKTNAVYFNTTSSKEIFNIRSHFYAPNKMLFGVSIGTFWFNISVIWLMTVVLFILLYFDVLKKIIEFRFLHKKPLNP